MHRIPSLALCITLVQALSAVVPAHADILHVPGDFPTIQAAINAAVGGDEVEVHPGTYFETINFLGKAIRVYSTDGPDATIIDATSLGQVSVVTCNTGEGFNTILDGFTITGGTGTVPGEGEIPRGGGMYVFFTSPTVSNCKFSGNTADFGGGMSTLSGSATVSNCTFTNNSVAWVGGGLATAHGSPTVSDCTFSNNSAVDGGGMRVFKGAPTIRNCLFDLNQAAEDGGGLFSESADTVVEGCVFSNNVAGDEGGGARMRVGFFGGELVTFTGCTFASNTSVDDGGGLKLQGAAVLSGCHFVDNISTTCQGGGLHHNSSNPIHVSDCIFTGNATPQQVGGGAVIRGMPATIERCTFLDNTAESAGGVYLAGVVTMTDCLFERNVAESSSGSGSLGGGVYVTTDFGIIRRCIIRNNKAMTQVPRGGGIYMSHSDNTSISDSLIVGNSATGQSNARGGGVNIENTIERSHLVNCTLFGNVATTEGDGIYVGNSATTTIDNCILWNNSISGKATVRYSDVQGGWPGEGNIAADPLFVDADGPDDILGNEDDNLRLQSVSPCIDAADNAATFDGTITDLDGNPRFVDDPDTPDTGNPDGVNPIVDMGAFEFQGSCVDDSDCDDGLFCNGDDICVGGQCTGHTGDPCTAGSECADTCNEDEDNCFDPPDTPCTDEGNECTHDVCDGDGMCTHPNAPDGTPCGEDAVCEHGICVAVVAIDIKSGSCPNSFNRHGNGVLPVALVGTVEFDPTEVDLSTLQLSRADGVGGSVAPNEGPPGPHSMIKDAARPFEGEPCDCQNHGPDGIDDLSMKFRTDELVEVLGLDALPGGAVIELLLSGSLLDGTPFVASDCIVILPPGDMSPANAHVASTVADTFVEVGPLDLNFDDDGFADFSRSYYGGTVMTLTAPVHSQGRRFVRWLVDTVPQLIGMRSIEVIVSEDTTLKAVYARPTHLNPDRPTEPDGPLE